jgi:hypothetical protein
MTIIRRKKLMEHRKFSNVMITKLLVHNFCPFAVLMSPMSSRRC